METTEKTPLIFKRMADIMEDIEAIGKNQTNTQQKYKFRGIDDVYNAVSPLLKKHRVFMTPEVIDSKNEVTVRKKADGSESIVTSVFLKVKTKFYAEDGSFVETIIQGEAQDYGDKASNKAHATAQKYSITQVFAIPTEDLQDNDKGKQGPDELKAILDEAKKITDKQPLIDWANAQDEMWKKNKEFVSEVNKLISKLK